MQLAAHAADCLTVTCQISMAWRLSDYAVWTSDTLYGCNWYYAAMQYDSLCGCIWYFVWDVELLHTEAVKRNHSSFIHEFHAVPNILEIVPWLWLAAQSWLLDSSLICVIDHIIKETHKKTTKKKNNKYMEERRWEKRKNIVAYNRSHGTAH